jgi:hypothetical protein
MESWFVQRLALHRDQAEISVRDRPTRAATCGRQTPCDGRQSVRHHQFQFRSGDPERRGCGCGRRFCGPLLPALHTKRRTSGWLYFGFWKSLLPNWFATHGIIRTAPPTLIRPFATRSRRATRVESRNMSCISAGTVSIVNRQTIHFPA